MNDSQLPIPRASSKIACIATQQAITTRLHNHIMQRQGDDAVLVPQAVKFSFPALTVKPGDDFLIVSRAEQERIQIWNLQQRVCIKEFNIRVIAVAFSEDGQICITGGAELRLWNTVKWESRVIPLELESEITAVAISSDKNHALAGNDAGSISLINLQSGQQVLTFKESSDKVLRLWFTHDGHILSYTADHIIRSWKRSNGHLVKSKSCSHNFFDWQLLYSNDDEPAVILASRKEVLLKYSWIERRTRRFDVASYGYFIRYVTLTSDHRRLLVVCSGKVICWDVESGECVRKIDVPAEGHRQPIALLQDNIHFVANNYRLRSLAVWNIETGEKVAEFGHAFLEVKDISSDGDTAILYDHISNSNYLFYNLCLIPVEFNDIPFVAKTIKSNSLSIVGAEIVFYKGCISGYDYKLMVKSIYDDHIKDKYHTYLPFAKTDVGCIVGFTISVDDKMVLTRSNNNGHGKICLWCVVSKNESSKLWEWESDQLFSGRVELSPDAGLSFAADQNGINIWDNRTGKLLATAPTDNGPSNDFCITPDSKKMLYCNDGVCVWDIEHATPIFTFTGHGNVGVSSVAVSPDGLLAASGDYKGIILLWDITDGSVLTTYRGHTRSVSKIVIIPEKGLLVSGAGDGTVRYWDLSSGKELARCYMTRDAMVTVTPNKRYDAPDGRCQHLRWTIDNKSYPLEYLKDRYYTPGLLKSVLDEHSAGHQKEKHDTSWGKPVANEGSRKQPSAKQKILMEKVSKYPLSKKKMLQKFLKESHALKQQPKLTQHQAMLLKELSPHQREVLMKGLAAKKELARRAALKEQVNQESSKVI